MDKESGNYSISTATVFITLLDVNDKAPVFEIKAYGFPLPLEPNEGYEIGQVKASIPLIEGLYFIMILLCIRANKAHSVRDLGELPTLVLR